MQTQLYDRRMAMTQISLRLSAVQRTHLVKLSAKLQIDQADVIRVAIAKLAEQEGITAPTHKR